MTHPEVKKFFAEISKQGGRARANKLSPKRRKEIAVIASKAAAKARSKAAAQMARQKKANPTKGGS